MVYRGDRLPADLYGNVFVAEPAANVVSRLIVTDDGTTLRARKAYERGEFLASTDERFRPVNLSNAPDGTLYVVDMYRGIIQHRAYITDYLRDHIVARKLEQPIGLGRIYRVVHDTTRRDATPALAAQSPAQLVAALSHPNGWWRDTAQRLLVERGARVASDRRCRRPRQRRSAPVTARTRLHALWTLDGIDRITPATVTKALADASRDVRASAIRIAERWLGDANHPIQAAVLERSTTPTGTCGTSWRRRWERCRPARARPRLSRCSSVMATTRSSLDAALSGLRGSEETACSRRCCAPDRADPAARNRTHDARGDDRARRAEWRRSSACSAGPPKRRVPAGSVRRCFAARRWRCSAPRCPAHRRRGEVLRPWPRRAPPCPGGRGGPGRRVRISAGAGCAGGGWRGGPQRAAESLSRRGSVLSGPPAASWPREPPPARADRVARQAGRSRAVTPLTAARAAAVRRRAGGLQEPLRRLSSAGRPRAGERRSEPRRFDARACAGGDPGAHPAQWEGRSGRIDAAGRARVTDEQIAAVLTYIRREWGQAGRPSPLHGRRNPCSHPGPAASWTNDELLAIGPQPPR